MAQGRSNRAIAEKLSVSPAAVEKHISAILTKLDLDHADTRLNRRVAAVLTFFQSYDPMADERA